MQIRVSWRSTSILTMMKEAAKSSETFISYITTWHHSPEDRDLNFHRRENLKSRKNSTNFSFKDKGPFLGSHSLNGEEPPPH